MFARRISRAVVMGGFLAVAVAVASPSALAQSQGAPFAALQVQVTALETQNKTLQAQIDQLSRQMTEMGGTAKIYTVYDGLGRKVGNLIGFEQLTPWVGMTVGVHSFALKVYPERLLGSPIWFAQPFCAGTPLIAPPVIDPTRPANVMSLAGLVDPGGVVFVTEPKVAAQSTAVRSLLPPDGPCQTFLSSFSRFVVPATPVAMGTVYTAPFTVR